MATSTYFAHKPTLSGQKVVLRPFTAADIELMAEVLADPDVIRLTGSARTTSETLDAPSYFGEREKHWYESRHAQGDRLDLAVVDAASDECVGEVVLNDLSEADDSCGFRILIGPRGRDRGLGSEAVGLLLDYAFERTPLHRIELEVYAFNPRARHVYERAGFVVEGRKRSSFRFDGEFVDTDLMSIIRSDREALR